MQDFEMQQAKLPKQRRKRPAVPDSTKQAMKRYQAAYKVVYKREPVLEYVAPYVRIDSKPGVTALRLKQLTQQLRDRARDMSR